MLKEEINDGVDNSCWAPPRVCHTCQQDSAYLCTNCTASRHERVWVCESCQRAPAEFLCKADAASLCRTCDAEIHSANPLARRHERVPILPPPMGSLYDPTVKNQGDEEDDDEAASWLLFNPGKDDDDNNKNSNNENNLFLFSEDADEYLDLVGSNFSPESQYPDQNSQYQQDYSVPEKRFGSDGVGSCRNRESGSHLQQQNFNLDMEYVSTKNQHNCKDSMNLNVLIPSIDMISVVPETMLSDVPAASQTIRPPMGTTELFSSQMLTQLTPIDREARVLRYREKKKTRRFEKTIRYASRKAYAETRPRIKGRFAKRADVEAQVDQVFSNSLLSETGYGIVPSF